MFRPIPLRYSLLVATCGLFMLTPTLSGCGLKVPSLVDEAEVPVPGAGESDSDNPGEDAPSNEDTGAGDDDSAGDQDASALRPSNELSCGGSISADTISDEATQLVDGYPCSTWDASGPEMTFSYVASEAGSVTASLSDTAADLDFDLYVLQDLGGGPDSATCLNYGNIDVTWEGVAGATYYVVVDGYMGAMGSFSLNLACGDSNSGGDGHGGAPPQPGSGGGPEGDDDDSPGTGICAANSPIGAGDSVNADTTALVASSAVDGYSCSGWDASGPELVYSFLATDSCEATASLSSIAAGQDLDIYVMEDVGSGCSSQQCMVFGNMSASWQAVAGTTYYVSVDGYNGDAGAFTLDLDCEGAATPAPTPTPGPAPSGLSGALSCGANQSGDTSTGSNSAGAHNYGCSSWDASGPEHIYSYVAASSGDVTVELSWVEPGQDLDVYVLQDQGAGLDPNNCLSYGDTTVTFAAIAGQTYYLVVDGYYGAAGSYTLELSCGPAAEPFVGRSHCLDWNSVLISDPSGIAGMLNAVGITLADYPLLLNTTAADANAGTISMMSAATQVASCDQDLSVPTWDLTASRPGTLSGNHFSVGPVDMGIVLGASTLQLYDVTIEGDFSADGMTISNGTMDGELDIDPLNLPWGTCTFALNCHSCPRGSGTCITFSAEQAVLNDNGQGPLTTVP